MGIFSDWCDFTRRYGGAKRLLLLQEKGAARQNIEKPLAQKIRSHYRDLEAIAVDVAELGYAGAASILKEKMPETSRQRSAELGEILATELTEEEFQYSVPVRRLRYKDGREMPMRGDDFIGIKGDSQSNLCILKGESKSKRALSRETVKNARAVLSRDDGHPTPISILFVADRLAESPDSTRVSLGRLLTRVVAAGSLASNRIEHMIFTLSKNNPEVALSDDLASADSARPHVSVNLRIDDHKEFIATVFSQAEDIGNT